MAHTPRGAMRRSACCFGALHGRAGLRHHAALARPRAGCRGGTGPSRIGGAHTLRAAATAALLCALLPQAAQAGGYRLATQSAAAVGTAGANGAEAADASTVFANPAGLTRLPGLRMSAVLEGVDPQVSFTDAGSSISLPGSGFSSRPTGVVGSTQSPAQQATIPRLFASWQRSADWSLGLGIFVPVGSQLTYDSGWSGRYNLRAVELSSLAVNPNLAWRPAPQWSVAAGLTAQRMEGRLIRAVPYGSAYAAGLLAAAQRAAAAGAPGLALQLQQLAAQSFGDSRYDGQVDIRGSGWGWGLNLALMWEPRADTRLGLSWRQGIRHTLKGSGDWTQPATLPADVLAAATGAPFDGSGKLDHNDGAASLRVTTPDTVSLHGWHQLSPSLALMADATWARESRLQQLRIDFANTTPDSVTAQHWKDTWSLALGAQWQATPALALRAGWALDRSPVPALTRTPAIPDAHRRWASLGARLALSPRTSVDLAAAHIRVKDAAMANTDDGAGETPSNSSNATVRGNYRSRATSLALQLNHQF